MSHAVEIFRHLPEHLQIWAEIYGSGLYAILSAIIFAETGLVVTPLLPGDSLLFATGAILALHPAGLSLPVCAAVLIAAAFCGDLLNYHIGKWAGPKVFARDFRWLNRKHLDRTREFYARHGGKTILLARFVPIVRTYAPFVAGVGAMPLRKYIVFSLTAAVLWIGLFLNLGYFFGNVPAVRKNFELVILAIVFVSLLPVVFEYLRARAMARRMLGLKSWNQDSPLSKSTKTTKTLNGL